MKKFILLIFLFLNFSIFCFAQQFTGKVTDAVDGRTIVIEGDNKTKFAVQLQFVEVPPSDTVFANTAKEHLKKLAVGKTATVFLRKITGQTNVGKVVIDGVDLSQQILLDGAAWYSLPEKDEHVYAERVTYLKLEEEAKNRNSGIWADASLKPSWIVKAKKDAEKENERIRKMQEEDSRQAAERQKKREQANANVQIWADVPDPTGTGGYGVKYDKYTDITQFGTSLMRLSINNPQLKAEYSLGVTKAFYGQDIKKAKGFSYFLTFKYYGLLTAFSSSTELRLVIGDQRIYLKNPKYEWNILGEKDEDTDWFYKTEFVRFQMNEEQFKIFTQGSPVEFRAGNVEGVITSGQIGTIKNLP